MSRRSSLFTLSASLLWAIVGPATAGPKELGAFVKGEWKANERPEVSIVMFRWGASGEKTLTSSKDRMLGQIASRGQTRIEIVMRTPPSKPPSSSGATSPPPSYEVRLQCGVQICGDGIFVPCGECPFARKYNGDSLVSRGAYTSNICCFNDVFERVSGVDTLHREQDKLLRAAASSLETMKTTQTKAGNFALAREIATYQDVVRQQKAVR